TNGKLEDKIGMNRVAAGQTWSNGFSMAFHDETK
ncbi:MAG: aldose 1-epimerase family protein, partial [Lactobacillus iners]|nr:aldose 1-epimerase family protein [Lactobacillus iners]